MNDNNCNLYVDFEGTLAMYDPNKIVCLENIFKKGFFAKLEPNYNIIDSVKYLYYQDINVFIICSVFNDSSKEEIKQWLNRYISEIPESNIIFCNYWMQKTDIINTNNTSFLIDDSTDSLLDWQNKGVGIKAINRINDVDREWKGTRIYWNSDPISIATKIKACIFKSMLSNNGLDLDIIKY